MIITILLQCIEEWLRNAFFAPALYEKIISLSRENVFVWENISPPNRDLGQLLARSRLGVETFSSYELKSFVG